MKDKNGKYITKPRAKQMLCRVIAESYARNGLKTIKPEKVQEIMNEYKFSRRSIHDTIICNWRIADASERAAYLATIHNFCFTVLHDGK